MNPQNGKGDKRRPEDKAKFDANFERIFGKGKPDDKTKQVAPKEGSGL